MAFTNCKTPDTYTKSTDERQESLTANDTVVIGSDENTYEIIIIDAGFTGWLASIARPEGYYSQSFMETRNNLFVTEWNNRVRQPQRFDPNLYQMTIDYNRYEDYGYEINYKLYNYFIFFQLTYKQRLSAFIPRI
ncbi:hypothetical protein J1C55_06080 [Winogradskyella sp. E313]|uniref:Uncharacterized protein n=1 Tax=Winogradskyella immobilis TaxID=2816852 RepID=A0ABS8ELQ9_9FLAO|nr:hypothetical protein [Winogradskyella immobilis]